VRVDYIRLCAFEPPDVTLLVGCSKGTYIRTLGLDIGEDLGCGAHLVKLRRTRCGLFEESACVSLSDLQERAEQGHPLPLLSPAEVLAHWPAFHVAGDSLARLKDGVAPSVEDLEDMSGLKENDQVRLMDGERLLALARYAPGGFGKRPGDFEILKVFPEVSS
jgi:tRNA pseudouridine55 synthase